MPGGEPGLLVGVWTGTRRRTVGFPRGACTALAGILPLWRGAADIEVVVNVCCRCWWRLPS